ncbi:MAG: HAD-IIIC family phosphatase [Candidatus Thorarchaeota archaeon]
MDDTDIKVKEILDSVRDKPTYLSHWSAFKKIEQMSLAPSDDEKKRLNMAVIGSSTLEPLAACVDIKARLHGLIPSTWVGGFNTFRQESLDSKSELYVSDPDLVILSVDAWSLVDQLFLSNFVRMDAGQLEDEMKRIVNEVTQIAKVLEDKSSALILVSNFIIPVFTPLGIVDNKQKIGLRAFIEGANRLLEERLRNSNRIFCVDVDSVAASFGKKDITNWNTWYRGSFPFSEDFTVYLADEYVRYIRALKGLSKKCIVLDMDNTLWGGVIGEDGMEGIKLGNTSPGIEFVDFQRALLSLYNRGVILALNSKNNFDDAIQVLREHPFQVLKEEHFAAYRINWQHKSQNLVELAKEINIGLDSMVFLDDNPHEREQVRQALPEVMVVDLPKNPRLYRSTLEQLDVFDVLSLTKEDLERGEMYVGKRMRLELEQSASNLEDFLRTLDLVVTVREVTDFDMPRVVQLIGKTNQFNLTTRRYSDAETKDLRDSKDSAVYCMSVKDKFGDEGLVGVAIVRKEDAQWTIDSFLMSCRVIKRSVETAFMAKIISDARKENVQAIEGHYIPTKRNHPASDFYERHNFGRPAQVGDDGSITSWMFIMDEMTLEVPEWITLIEE